MMERWDGSLRDGWRERGRVRNSQTIYTLDIEVTTLLHYPDGWRPFDYTGDPDAGRKYDKVAVPYIWMFGIEDRGEFRSYYGRDFGELYDVFNQLADEEQKKIIWVHNLSYEFQFLRDILPEVTGMIARRARHPIKFEVKEWNLEFRCSYCLTNMSLKTASEQYGEHVKLSGEEFDYNASRGSYTALTDKQMEYCERDVEALYEVVRAFRRKYKKLQWIPLTSTGEIRKEFRHRVPPGYIYKVRKLVPKNAHIFLLLWKAFMGGITHALYLRVNQVISNLISADIASSYSAVMCSEKYPRTPFHLIKPEKLPLIDFDVWAALIHVRFKGARSRYFNHYILRSSCVSIQNGLYDNGRLISGDVEMVITDIDYQIIKESYDIEEEEVIEVYISKKDYLPKEFIEYVLYLYEGKTTLKNVAGQEELYRDMKTRINGQFGCCVQNIIKNSSEYVTVGEEQDWKARELTMDFVEEKLEELRNSRSNLYPYQYGVWITAAARRRLWEIACFHLDPKVVGIDKAAVYYDTDSTKAPDSPEFRKAMEESNEEIDRKLREMCDAYDIDYERTRPRDKYGEQHPLGHWEKDGDYIFFKCLGAKRYAYEDTSGIHLTVAGVNPKKGAKALTCVDDLRKDMVFDFSECGRTISYYLDDMPEVEFVDIDGNTCRTSQKHGVALVPSTYHMSIDDLFEALYEGRMEGVI